MDTGYIVVTIVGSSVAMAAALAFGFKKMVDLVGIQLQTQNGMIEKLQAASTGELLKLTEAVDRTTEAVATLERHAARDAEDAAMLLAQPARRKR